MKLTTDYIGDNPVIQIDEAHHHQGCNEDEGDKERRGEAELENQENREEGHHRLNQRIPCRYRGLTRSTLTPEQEVAEDGDIIIRLYGSLAPRAMRKRGDEGFPKGNPEDADIEKASHNGPEEEGKDIGKN
jgi:hypothetical protein